jgi:dihydrofolate reductase
MNVILMMVMTADGFIAKDSNQNSTDWSSSEDKDIFIERTKQAGVIIMGLATYKTIGKPLPNRLNMIMTLNPEVETSIPDKLEFIKGEPHEILSKLEARGFSEVILGGGTTINTLFLKAGLVDEIQVTVEPLLFGGGLTLFKDLDLNQKMELLEVKQLGNSVINLRYKLINKQINK